MEREYWVTGGGFVTASGYGCRGDGPVRLAPGEPRTPPAAEIFERPPARFGRLDAYTRCGCAAVALALREAALDRPAAKRPIGMVTASRWETLETDRAFQESTRLHGGALASPNLFSYTLPGIVQGECAVHFLLAGPTLSLGEGPWEQRPDGSLAGLGMTALETALFLLEQGAAQAVLAGWLDAPPSGDAGREGPAGAVFVLLEGRPRPEAERSATPLAWRAGHALHPDGRPVGSLLDFFDAPSPTRSREGK